MPNPASVSSLMARTQPADDEGVLTEVADAFSAVEELISPRVNGAAPQAGARVSFADHEPIEGEGMGLQPVRRVDTMDLLELPVRPLYLK